MKGRALRRTIAALALAFAFGLPARAADRGPSTLAERKRAVEVTRRLEKFPLAQSANADRVWLMKWINDIPDITVRTCAGLLDPLAIDEDSKYGRKLYAQSMFGMTAFMIENPARKDDWVAVQTAGVESTLKAYQSLLQAKPDARWDVLDKLLTAQKEGNLGDLVENALDGCGDERPPGPGDAI
jgi:hypothetical protein